MAKKKTLLLFLIPLIVVSVILASMLSMGTSVATPVANFSWKPERAPYTQPPPSPTVNETVIFNASASSGNITSYAWDFDGDGGVDKTVNETITTWNFTTAGTYNVTLNVTDTGGLWDTVSHLIEVIKPYLSLNPREYTVLAIGDNFTIDVNITGVTNLGAFEFKLWYDTSILDAIDTSSAGLVTENNTNWRPIPINDTQGLVHAGSRFPTGKPFNGSAILLKITFISTARGNTTLRLNETRLLDPSNNSIPHDVIPTGSVQAEIEVLPEFPTAIILPLLLTATAAAVLLGKIFWSRKRKDALIAE